MKRDRLFWHCPFGSKLCVLGKRNIMKKALKTIKRFGPLYLMMLPACIYIFINNYVPLPGVSLAFRQYNFQKGIYGSPFIGLSNFKFLFASKDAWIIIRNTIGYNLYLEQYAQLQLQFCFVR